MLFVSIMVGYANTEYNDVKRGAFEDPLFAARASLVDKARSRCPISRDWLHRRRTRQSLAWLTTVADRDRSGAIQTC
jgi:hypothetical protein